MENLINCELSKKGYQDFCQLHMGFETTCTNPLPTLHRAREQVLYWLGNSYGNTNCCGCITLNDDILYAIYYLAFEWLEMTARGSDYNIYSTGSGAYRYLANKGYIKF